MSAATEEVAVEIAARAAFIDFSGSSFPAGDRWDRGATHEAVKDRFRSEIRAAFLALKGAGFTIQHRSKRV